MDRYSINNIVKLLGIIGMYISLFFLIPIFTGLYYREDVFRFLVFDFAFFLLNALMFLIFRNYKIVLSLKEGILSVNLIWVLVAFAGSIPLWLYSDVTFMQAIFESISGFTTTGASIYKDVESLPNMILILRSLMHWLGGMGILVLGVGLLSLINPSGSLTLFKAETSGVRFEKSTPKIRDTAIMLWKIYIMFTLMDAILLNVGGMSVFDAINHAFSTISTGGFSTKNDSLAGFDTPFVLWTTTFFMLISGITFLAHLKTISGDFSGYKNEETKWYIIVFAVLSFTMAFSRYLTSSESFFSSLTHACFNIASLMTTTGFVSDDYESWGQISVALAFLAMIASGNGGSTAGGIKIIRHVVSMKVIIAELKKILHPNAIIRVFINNVPVSNSLISMTFGFVTLFVITNALVTSFLYASGYDAMTSISTALACVGNIGPGFGMVGPTRNYAFFDDFDLSVLSVAMIIGRLEILTFLLVFVPSFWRRF